MKRPKLSRKDFQLYKALKTIPKPSLLAVVVEDFLKNPKVSRFNLIKETLKQHLADDPITTQKALGPTICEKLQLN